jgi:hypothetical protein
MPRWLLWFCQSVLRKIKIPKTNRNTNPKQLEPNKHTETNKVEPKVEKEEPAVYYISTTVCNILIEVDFFSIKDDEEAKEVVPVVIKENVRLFDSNNVLNNFFQLQLVNIAFRRRFLC